MKTRDKFGRFFANGLAVLAATALFSCAMKNDAVDIKPVVWQTSENNGDKPGVGYEIIEGGKPIGSFLLFEPGKPRNFDTAARMPMTLVKVSANEYNASIRAANGETDELSIRFVGGSDAITRKAVIQQLNRPSTAEDFTFVRRR